MSEVGQIVRDALVLAGITDAADAPEAEDMTDGIRWLNRMMRSWEVDGFPLGWSNIDNPADTLPAPVEAEEAITYNLAGRLCGLYAKPFSVENAAVAAASMATLRAFVTSTDYARTNYDDLPRGIGQRGGSWLDGFYR